MSSQAKTSLINKNSSVSTHSQSSDAHTSLNVNDELYEIPRCPMGVDQAKRKRKGVHQTSSANMMMNECLDRLNENIDKLCEAYAKRNKMKALSLLMKDVSMLPDRERVVALKIKEKIARDYNIDFSFEVFLLSRLSSHVLSFY